MMLKFLLQQNSASIRLLAFNLARGLAVVIAFVLCGYNVNAQNLILSSRSFHPKDNNDTLSTLKMIDELNIKQIDWMYDANPAHLNQLKARGVKYGLAMNPQIPDSGGYTTPKFRIKNMDGTPYVVSRMQSWKIKNPYWGCVNNPGFQKLFYDNAVKLINVGAYSIFVDDPLLNAKLQRDKPDHYGCFCDYCVNGFKAYLSGKGLTVLANSRNFKRDLFAKILSNSDNMVQLYEDYQEKSVVDFLTNWRNKLKSYKPGIILLCNNYNAVWNTVYSIFDGGIAELNVKNLNKQYLDKVYADADRRHKIQKLTLVSNDLQLHYYLMAYNFLNNRDYIMPWDVYVTYSPDRFSASIGDVKNIKDFFDQCDTTGAGIKQWNRDDSGGWTKTIKSKRGGSLVFVLSDVPVSKSIMNFSLKKASKNARTGAAELLNKNNKSAVQIYKQ